MKENLLKNLVFRGLPLLVSVVLAVFLLLIGSLTAIPVVYYLFVVATSAIALFGIWYLTKRAMTRDHDIVLTVIGSGGLSTLLVFDVSLTLAYRGYLHLLGNDGAVIAVFFIVNALAILLLAFLPSYESFAVGLSTGDQRTSKPPVDFFSRLEAVERSYVIACRDRSISIRPSEPCKVRSLREQARCLSPSRDDGQFDSIDEEIYTALADLREHIEEEDDKVGVAEPKVQRDVWTAETYRKCGYIEKLFRKREAIV